MCFNQDHLYHEKVNKVRIKLLKWIENEVLNI